MQFFFYYTFLILFIINLFTYCNRKHVLYIESHCLARFDVIVCLLVHLTAELNKQLDSRNNFRVT